MSEKNEEIAKEIQQSWKEDYANPDCETALHILIKKALDSKDSESAQLRAEVERLHQFYQDSCNDTLALNAGVYDKQIASLKATIVSQSLLIEKLRDGIEKIGVNTDHGDQEPCEICKRVDELLALLHQDEKKGER